MRASHLIVLTLHVLSPISHGAGTAGNEQILRTQDYILNGERIAIPEVSGASLKATLREHAVLDMCEVLGISELSKDRLRLLLKGGQNGPGGQSVSLDEMRRLRKLFPLLAVFGSMDAGMPIRGQITVSPARVWCRELVDSGLIPRTVVPLHVEAEADEELPPNAGIPILPGVEPVPAHLARGHNEYFRHDMRTSHAARLLPGAEAAQLEDKAAARKGKSATKEERRDANESMPHSYQTIIPGTWLVAEVRLEGASDIEVGCLARAIARWAGSGGAIGGAVSRGHGSTRVEAAGHIQFRPGHAANGTAVAVGRQSAAEGASAAFVAHLRELQAEITREVAA